MQPAFPPQGMVEIGQGGVCVGRAMGKKLSKGEKLDLILEELSKIRDALEALGRQKGALAGKAGKKRPHRKGLPRRASRAKAAAASPP